MKITSIRSEQDLLAAIEEVNRLSEENPKLGTPAGDQLDFLASLIVEYEAEHYPI